MAGMRSIRGQKKNINRFWNRHASGGTKNAVTNNTGMVMVFGTNLFKFLFLIFITVTFPTFSVKEAIEMLSSGGKLHSCKPEQPSPPDTVQYWDGSVFRVAADRDDIPVVVHLPGLNQSHTVRIIVILVGRYNEIVEQELTSTAMDLMYV